MCQSLSQRILCMLLTVGAVFFFAVIVFADVNELRSEIDKRSSLIGELEKEIEVYGSRINALGKEAQTLENTVQQIELTEQKFQVDIRLTEQRSAAASQNIRTLTRDIEDKNVGIKSNSAAIGEILRRIHELESQTLIEILLAEQSFSVFWDTVESLGQLQANVHRNVKKLRTLKYSLEEKRSLRARERERHVVLASQLSDQKALVTANRREKENLLRQTKNQESSYKKLLEEKQELKEALEREVQDFEAQIQLEIDPNSLPKTGTAILRWPLDNVFITQYFGNTPFASKNPQVYSGSGHNGTDFRAQSGTIVRAAANGVVVDVGNTDAQCYGASYGKWVLIRHYNNLATLYAHLSLIRVEPGEELLAGDVLGYSGNTGYSTGPHLHFSVYAASAVRVTDEYRSRVCGTYLKLPLSPRNGYLNPLSYLPTLDN